MRYLLVAFLLSFFTSYSYSQYTYDSQIGVTSTSSAADGSFEQPNGVVVDADGNIYVADRNNERVQKFNSTGGFVLKWGSSGTGDGQFSPNNGAVDLAVDSDGNVWVVDRGNHRLQKFSSTGAFLFKIGSAGTGDGQFNQPTGITINSGDTIYVGDRLNERVQAFDKNGNFLFKWGGTAGSGDSQFASNNGPVDLAVDSEGNVFVVDRGNHRVQKFSKKGDFLGKFGSSGSGASNFNQPNGITVAPDGTILIADRNNARVSIWTDTNNVFANSSAFGSSGTGDGQFNATSGATALAFDPLGDLWVTDRGHHRLMKFDGPDLPVSAPSSATVAATVFLEGAYNGSSLNTTINGSIPSAQPYSGSTFNSHSGTENASAPAGAVDWVLVELREAASAATALNSTKVGSAAGFLMSNGSIKATDGSSDLTVTLSGNTGSDFYVVIYHRNHLPIMSASAISESSATYTIDFTGNSANTYQSTTALSSLSGGKFGMPAGDLDQDGDIDATDLSTWRTNNGATFNYSSSGVADFNLDGVINAVDRNDFHQKNTSKTRQVPGS